MLTRCNENEPGTKEKNIAKCFVWSVATYAVETWTLTETDRRRIEAYEMQIQRRRVKESG